MGNNTLAVVDIFYTQTGTHPFKMDARVGGSHLVFGSIHRNQDGPFKVFINNKYKQETLSLFGAKRYLELYANRVFSKNEVTCDNY